MIIFHTYLSFLTWLFTLHLDKKFIIYPVVYLIGDLLFEPGMELKEKILEYLKDDELSISALTRKLNEKEFMIHKLTLAGYLKALEDMRVLKHKKIPPSKVYYISKTKEKTIYEAIGDKIKSLEKTPAEQAQITLFSLQKLFHRAIFYNEMKRCGFDTIDANRVTGDDRAEVRKKLIKSGFKIKTNEPLYSIENNEDNEEYHKILDNLILELLIEKFKIKALILETKQIKLSK